MSQKKLIERLPRRDDEGLLEYKRRLQTAQVAEDIEACEDLAALKSLLSGLFQTGRLRLG